MRDQERVWDLRHRALLVYTGISILGTGSVIVAGNLLGSDLLSRICVGFVVVLTQIALFWGMRGRREARIFDLVMDALNEQSRALPAIRTLGAGSDDLAVVARVIERLQNLKCQYQEEIQLLGDLSWNSIPTDDTTLVLGPRILRVVEGGRAINEATQKLTQALNAWISARQQLREHYKTFEQGTAFPYRRLGQISEVVKSVFEFSERARLRNDAARTSVSVAARTHGAIQQDLALVNDRTQEALRLVTELMQLSEEHTKNLTLKSFELTQVIGEARNIVVHLEGMALQFETVEGFVHAMDLFAKRTKMLAVNAAIEGAQPSISGGGFRVIADEIKQLAEQGQASANELHEAVSATRASALEGLRYVRAWMETLRIGDDLIQLVDQDAQRIIPKATELLASLRASSGTLPQIRGAAAQLKIALDRMLVILDQQTSDLAQFRSETPADHPRTLDLDNAVQTLVAQLQSDTIAFDSACQKAEDGLAKLQDGAQSLERALGEQPGEKGSDESERVTTRDGKHGLRA